ncbi:ABC transporter substrate-binding protein, partial [Staphylococcus epidermidis]|uniref:ABC transporter substrate-binding protein n=1 Tax=Staphylococcus epidermidis TaxID=1282 RepID=UPI0011A62EF1
MHKLTLPLQSFLNPHHIPLILPIQKACFKQQSLQIHIIQPNQHFHPLHHIQNPSIHIPITQPIHLLQHTPKQQKLIPFPTYLHTNPPIIYNKHKNIPPPKH